MTARFAALLTAVGLLAPAAASAQQLDLPRPSPFAKSVQTVGLTDITVDYSSPKVNGRKIWGALVPYGQVWRAGANAATKVTFSKDVTIGSTVVPAASYAFFVIPKDKGAAWTVIFNKVPTQSGAFDYKQDQDILRLDVKPETIPNRERLAYLITDFTNDDASITLEWERVRLRVPVKVGTDAQVTTYLGQVENNLWSPACQAARFELDAKNYDAGLKWVEKSLAIQEDWLNDWTKAQLLAGQKKFADALPLAQKAQDLGTKTPARFFAADDVKKALVDWKGKH